MTFDEIKKITKGHSRTNATMTRAELAEVIQEISNAICTWPPMKKGPCQMRIAPLSDGDIVLNVSYMTGTISRDRATLVVHFRD